MTGTLICDEDGLYDPRNFNDRLLLGMKGQISEAELHFIRARLRGGQLSKARRGELVMPLPIGLVYDAAGHVILDPDTAIQGALAAPVHHVRGRRVGHRRGEGVPRRRAVLPLAAPQRPPQGRGRLAAAAALHRAAGAAQPPLRRRVHLRPDRPPAAARREARRVTLPREEWTSFIPGAHPGYITLDQYEANTARLAANAAAHGRDRAAGPPREGPALLQGIIICGRCGGRMTIRYHARGGKDLPTYLCQRDGIDNARRDLRRHPRPHPRRARRPAAHRHPHPAGRRGRPPGLRRTPAASRRSRRAARRPRRARPLPRRPGPPPLPRRRPRQPARRRHPRSRLEHRPARAQRRPGRLRQGPRAARRAAHRRPEGPDRPARHRPARHLERPRHPDARAQAHRPAAAHRRHRDPHQRHHHRARPPGRRPAPHPHPASPQPAWKIRQTKASTIAEIDKLLDHHTCAEIAAILRSRGLANGEGRPFNPTMVQRVIRTYQLRSRRQRLLDTGLIPLSQMAAAARRVHRHRQDLVPRRNCQRAAV